MCVLIINNMQQLQCTFFFSLMCIHISDCRARAREEDWRKLIRSREFIIHLSEFMGDLASSLIFVRFSRVFESSWFWKWKFVVLTFFKFLVKFLNKKKFQSLQNYKLFVSLNFLSLVPCHTSKNGNTIKSKLITSATSFEDFFFAS
jgi:hypothetical protein